MRRYISSSGARCAVIAALAIASPIQAKEAGPNPWRAMAETDVEAAIKIVQDVSAAPVDSQNKAWSALFGAAAARARAQAREVDSLGGYRATLNRLFGSFEDEHMNVQLRVGLPQFEWTGFTVRHINGKYFVHESIVDDVTVGTEISTCDGRLFEAWIVDDIIPYAGGGAVKTLEADKAEFAPWVLVDQRNPFTPRPKSCLIAGKQVQLRWRTISSDELKHRASTAFLGAERPTYGYREFSDDGIWVQLPSFNPRTDEDVAAFNRIIAVAPAWRDRKIVVIDVRKNGGGNSMWFRKLLTALYGERYVKYYARAGLDQTVEYRVTPEALAYYDDAAPRIRKHFGDASREARQIDIVVRELRSAASEGRKIYVEKREMSAEDARPSSPGEPLMKAHVFVLTDYQCGSACLTFIDEIRLFPNIEQVGLPTHADTPYANILKLELPNGNGTVGVGTMIRRRARQTNVPWIPVRRFEGDITDTPSVEAWIVDMAKKGS